MPIQPPGQNRHSVVQGAAQVLGPLYPNGHVVTFPFNATKNEEPTNLAVMCKSVCNGTRHYYFPTATLAHLRKCFLCILNN
jgi:hypothetical protein